MKPEIEELLVKLRKALHFVCEELRRTHKCNKHLEERQNDLAAELEELKSQSGRPTRPGGAVKVNEHLNQHITVPSSAVPLPVPIARTLAYPAKPPQAAPPAPTASPALATQTEPAALTAPVPVAAASTCSSVPAASETRNSGDRGKLRGSSDRSLGLFLRNFS